MQRFLAQEGITEDEFGNMCQNELNAENLQPGGTGSPNAQSGKYFLHHFGSNFVKKLTKITMKTEKSASQSFFVLRLD